MKTLRSVILCLGLVLSVQSWAMSTEVVDIYYRSASEMIGLVKPHLEPGETVSGLGGKLVLRLKPEHRSTILALVKQLDQRPGQLLVTVRQGGTEKSDSQQAVLSGGYQYRDGRASGSVNAHIEQQELARGSQTEQQLRVQDGQAATFYVGQVVPVRTPPVTSPDGYLVHEGVYYEEVLTGFVVRPRLRGQQVFLEIGPQQESVDGRGAIDTRFAQTTLEAALGQWVEIGQVIQHEHSQQQGIASDSRRHSQHQARIQIRVDRSE